MAPTHEGTRPSTRQMFRERYLSGDVPWEHDDPPPEIIDLAASIGPGRALDLGCGQGRSSLHLARIGWVVDAFDFVHEAVAEARRKARAGGVSHRASFCVADVTQLPLVCGTYDLAVDVGCSHRLPRSGMTAVNSVLRKLLRHGGRYVVFAKLREHGQAPGIVADGLDESMMLDVHSHGFVVERIEHGTTKRQDGTQVPSAWFWFRRT